MKRKDYRKPTMRVVKLQHRTLLLAGSQVGATNTIIQWGDGGVTDEEQIYM